MISKDGMSDMFYLIIFYVTMVSEKLVRREARAPSCF